MTISHQTVLDAEGHPTAAIIPWEEFLEVQKLLHDEMLVEQAWKEEISARIKSIDSGEATLLSHEEVMRNARAILKS